MNIRSFSWAGPVAALLFIVALLGFGSAMRGYSQVWHPVAVLGAHGMPHALGFNVLGFVVTGVLAAVAAVDLRRRLPGDAGWTLRVGAQLILLSALGFAAMGLLPLDPDDLDNPASSLHATAWMLWWVAFVPGALLVALGLRGRPHWRPLALISVVAALLVLFVALLAVELMPAGIAQRLGYLSWLGWLWMASRNPGA